MKIHTTFDERAAMVPEQVRSLAILLTKGSDVTTTRIAGGAVRDMLLGVQPKDWDLATILLPEAVIEKAERYGLTVIPTGLQHGTVTVVFDGMPLEVTTLRTDVETDGRHADVEFITDWREDAKRRDLTMNALFMDIDGLIFDYVGGMDDLKAGIVRFVGDPAERITEDFLRILRFFRFAGRMQCEHFDPIALSATLHLSPNLNRISGERVWMEMSKILTGNMLADVLNHMEHANVLASIGIANPDIAMAVRANEMGGSAATVLAALVDSPTVAKSCADAWKLSKNERKVLDFVAGNGMTAYVKTLDQWKIMVVAYDKELVTEAMCLTTKTGWIRAINDWDVPVFPLTGDDVLATGIAAGPKVGELLNMCKSYWVGTKYTMTKDEMIELITTIGEKS
jgi:hypothetical protein